MNKEKQFEWNENRVDEFIEDIQNHISGSFRHYDFAQWKENFKQSKIEPVKQPSPERIEVYVVKHIGASFVSQGFNKPPYEVYEFLTTKVISEDKFHAIKQAIEKALNEDTVVGSVDNFVWTEELAIHFAIELRNCKEINHKEQKSWRDSLREFKERILSEFPETQKTDTVVEDNDTMVVKKDYWKQVHDDLRFLEATLDANAEKVYTKKEVDAIREETVFWTDEMVLLLCDFCHHNGWHHIDKSVKDEFDEFKSIPCHKRMIPDWIKKHVNSLQSTPEKQPPLVDNSNIPDEILSEWITKARPLVDSAFNVGIDAVLKTINEWEIVYIPPELISQIHNLKKPITQ